MHGRSPFTLLLLVLLFTTSHTAMAAHEVAHKLDPGETQQCPLCVNANPPCDDLAPDALPDTSSLKTIHYKPACMDFQKSGTAFHDQNPRAPPTIA